MNEDISKISDHIYLGNLWAAVSEDMLKERNITYVLSVGEDPDDKVEGVEYQFIEAEDVDDEIISRHFEKTNEAI